MEVCTENLPADLFRPRSLSMLMGLYETNYHRLMSLLGESSGWTREFCLHLEGRPGLHVEVSHRARYTVDIVMTHHFETERLPDLHVRLYHDARLAEAMPLSGHDAGHRPWARLPHRWHANVLLYKWLEYCMDATSRSLQAEAPPGARLATGRELG
ncbi:MAG: DUF1249 domain-containing protein [Gammaproteobacteria bacterium]|nr:DUF1249 domain-containing protein [Gammaproteobacteria bacterium]